MSVADNAFHKSGWAAAPPRERAAALSRLADAVREHGEALAEIEALDTGKTRAKAKGVLSQLQPWIHYGTHGKRNGSPHWLSIVKESLTILGRDVGRPRLPLQPLTSVERKDLEKAVQAAIS